MVAIVQWVRERLLFGAEWLFVLQYHSKSKLHVDEMMSRLHKWHKLNDGNTCFFSVKILSLLVFRVYDVIKQNIFPYFFKPQRLKYQLLAFLVHDVIKHFPVLFSRTFSIFYFFCYHAYFDIYRPIALNSARINTLLWFPVNTYITLALSLSMPNWEAGIIICIVFGFDLTGVRTHDLPKSEQARYPSRNRMVVRIWIYIWCNQCTYPSQPQL